MNFEKYLTQRKYTLLKQFKVSDDRFISLVRRPDGTSVVWRLYEYTVPAYKRLIGLHCSELPEVYHYIETESGGCLVEEEFIDGISLAELMEASTRNMDEQQTAAIVRQVCCALSVLHRHNMVHRDVKPENILITSKGRVVLIDLDAVSPKDSDKDRDTRLLGTVGYAAPEQYGFGHSDGRADIFGVGVLMNVLLTGTHPARQLTEGFLRPVVEKCIAVNVNQRYATAEDLMAQLPNYTQQVCQQCGFTSPGGGCIFCNIPNAVLPRRKHLRNNWFAAAVLLALLVGVGAWISTDVPSEKHTETIDDLPPVQTEAVKEEPAATPTPSDLITPVPALPEITSKPTPEPTPTVQETAPPPSPEPTPEPSVEPAPEVSVEPVVQTSSEPNSTVSALPVYSGEYSYELTPFLYDLNEDGEEEEYYFAFMYKSGHSQACSNKLVIGVSSDSTNAATYQIAPVVWMQGQNGTLVPVPRFAALLQDVSISWYQYKGSKNVPSIRDAEPINGLWQGTTEVSCNCETGGNWIARASATIGETPLSAEIYILTRGESTLSSVTSEGFLLTDGTAIGDPIPLEYSGKSELLFGDYTVFGCTAQQLDNGYIRFVVDYEGPEELTITAFDPPDGILFKYSGKSETSGQREQLIFDMPAEQIRSVAQFTISFRTSSNGRFLVFVKTEGL